MKRQPRKGPNKRQPRKGPMKSHRNHIDFGQTINIRNSILKCKQAHYV